MPVQIAMYKGRGLIGNAITRWWTGSQYSHVELVIDGICYSASFMDGGVRAKVINLSSGKWDLIPADWIDADRALEFFRKTKGAKYDWFGIFGAQMFNRRRHMQSRYFCSEWLSAAAGLPNAEIYSPYALMKLAMFFNARGWR